MFLVLVFSFFCPTPISELFVDFSELFVHFSLCSWPCDFSELFVDFSDSFVFHSSPTSASLEKSVLVLYN